MVCYKPFTLSTLYHCLRNVIFAPWLQPIPHIEALLLINSDTDQAILNLTDGLEVNIDCLQTKSFNIEAIVSDDTVGSVVFGYNSNSQYMIESLSPYAFCGDIKNDYYKCTALTVGQHTISATSYSRSKGNGRIGSTKVVSFNIVDVKSTFIPSNVPVSAPAVTATIRPMNVPLSVPETTTMIRPTNEPTLAPQVSTKSPLNAPIRSSCTYPKFDTNWQSFGPNYPLAVAEAQATIVDNDIFIFGGYINVFSDVTNKTFARDIRRSNSTWRQMDDMPVAIGITHAATVTVGLKVYMCGGYSGARRGPHVSSCFVYDHSKAPGNGQWSNFTKLPNDGSGGGGMIYDQLKNALFYSGGGQRLVPGSLSTSDTSKTWKYSFDKPNLGWVESTPIPYKANHLSAVTNKKISRNGRHFFLGGQMGQDEIHGNVADVFEFMATNETWIRRASMPVARSHTTASTREIGCGFIMAGGSINSPTTRLNRTNEILYYDIPLDSWLSIGTLPIAGATQRVFIDDYKNMYVIDDRRSSRRVISAV